MKFQWMHNFRLALRHDRAWRWLGLTAIAGNLASWLIISRISGSPQTLTPLHYTIYFGPDLSFNPRYVLLLPGLGLAILLLNLGWSNSIDDQLWRRTWIIITVILSLLILAISAALVYIARTTP